MLVRLDINVYPQKDEHRYPDAFQFEYNDEVAKALLDMEYATRQARALVPHLSATRRWWNDNEADTWFDVGLSGQWVRTDDTESSSHFVVQTVELVCYVTDHDALFTFVSEEENSFAVIETTTFSLYAIDKAYRNGTTVWYLDQYGEVVKTG